MVSSILCGVAEAFAPAVAADLLIVRILRFGCWCVILQFK